MLCDITDNSLIRTKQTVFSITGYTQKKITFVLSQRRRGVRKEKNTSIFLCGFASLRDIFSPEQPLPRLRPGVEVNPEAVAFDIGEVRLDDLAVADPVEVDLPGIALADAALLRDAGVEELLQVVAHDVRADGVHLRHGEADDDDVREFVLPGVESAAVAARSRVKNAPPAWKRAVSIYNPSWMLRPNRYDGKKPQKITAMVERALHKKKIPIPFSPTRLPRKAASPIRSMPPHSNARTAPTASACS